MDLHRAARENRVDIARALVARGDDIDARDEDGESSLRVPVHALAHMRGC
ncbi:MAG: ankyrin repeat domain-containing protein [Vicinamibacterales bacterium]|nr:ankyrin repeat domain-containing protein [Vicinamibacterales bacterium]